jgi:tryptophanyl-tRNA synthetase
MSITTDTKTLEDIKDSDTCNIFALIKLFWTKEKIEEIRKKYLKWNYWYGHAKLELLEILNNLIKPLKEKRDYLENHFEIIEKKLKEWNIKMNQLATDKYNNMKKIVWL